MFMKPFGRFFSLPGSLSKTRGVGMQNSGTRNVDTHTMNDAQDNLMPSEPDSSRSRIIDILGMGQLDAAKEVINKVSTQEIGGLINQKDDMGRTCAHVAAERNDLPALKWLTSIGADLSVVDESGRTPVGWARKNNNDTMIDFIEKQTVIAREHQQLPANGQVL